MTEQQQSQFAVSEEVPRTGALTPRNAAAFVADNAPTEKDLAMLRERVDAALQRRAKSSKEWDIAVRALQPKIMSIYDRITTNEQLFTITPEQKKRCLPASWNLLKERFKSGEIATELARLSEIYIDAARLDKYSLDFQQIMVNTAHDFIRDRTFRQDEEKQVAAAR